ncbi:MAG TPA: gamma-glutamyltransferase family protein, partial [Gammaproteobacteria bacterium]|nr:gamma-glutamyltransferase family protein [Gammaproteobacteria bacterium]
DNKKTLMFDGRETAPQAATIDLFMREGEALLFHEAGIGGRGVGTPGILKMLKLAHDQYGRLPWADLFMPAIQLAEQGFIISPRLAKTIKEDLYLSTQPAALAYFYHPDGQAKQAGERLKNKALAKTLRRIADEGIDAFYTGPIAEAMVNAVQQHPENKGLLSLSDLADYTPKIRAPICSVYRTFEICGASPPAAGGIVVAQLLALFNHVYSAPLYEQTDLGLNFTPDAIHYFSEAGKLAYADRDYYIADPDFVSPPGDNWSSMIDPKYLATRARLISERGGDHADPGDPGAHPVQWGVNDQQEFPSTAHIAIADQWGQVLSMTTSIADVFGSRLMVHGFLLNNQLTDFSFAPIDAAGKPIANCVAGGKRPRSSASPSIVFDLESDRPILSVGSAGGPNIINYVAKTLVSTLYGGSTLQMTMHLPNMGSRNGPVELELGRFPFSTVSELTARGHAVNEVVMMSGLQGLMRPDAEQLFWQGANDPRREGTSIASSD